MLLRLVESLPSIKAKLPCSPKRLKGSIPLSKRKIIKLDFSTNKLSKWIIYPGKSRLLAIRLREFLVKMMDFIIKSGKDRKESDFHLIKLINSNLN